MKNKVLIVYPLFYSPYSLFRLSSYLSYKNDNLEKEVAIFCSNKEIEKLALQFSVMLKFKFFPRDNFGGGEGVFFEFAKVLDLKEYDYIVYLEESCEPISRYWLETLVDDLKSGSLITGWHWNWRGKKRSESIKVAHGKGKHIALSYLNTSDSLPSKRFGISEIMDTPGFRHECIAFQKSALDNIILGCAEKELWSKFEKKEFGLAMERFYWHSSDGKGLVSPNIQYLLLRTQYNLPKFTSKNYKLFHELRNNEKNSSVMSHYEWKFRKKRLYNFPRIIFFKFYNFLKFMLVVKFNFDLDSKLKDVL
jgi:hypothetical protein